MVSLRRFAGTATLPHDDVTLVVVDIESARNSGKGTDAGEERPL